MNSNSRVQQGLVSSESVIYTQGSHSALKTRNCCFKAFIITTLVCSLIAVITGIFAVLQTYGKFSGLNALSAMGDVNSYLIILGGASLCVLSIIALYCLLKKEKDPNSRFSRWN